MTIDTSTKRKIHLISDGPWSKVENFSRDGVAISKANNLPPIYYGISMGPYPIGLKSSRTGYKSVAPHVIPRPATLTLTRVIIEQRAEAEWYRASLNDRLLMLPSEFCLSTVLVQVMTDTAKVDNKARMSFLKKATEGANVLPIIGEARQTARAVQNDATKLSKGLTSILDSQDPKKWTRLRSTGGALKAASDLWLSVAYGYKPLVGDIRNGLVALDDLNYFSRPKISGRASLDRNQSFTVPRMSVLNGLPNQSGSPLIGDLRVSGFTTYDSAFGATWAPSPGTSTYKALGLQWSDVLPAAWELFPYSFLVDYFTNIGEVIGGHSFDFTNWSRLWTLTNLTTKLTVELRPQPPNGNYAKVSATPGKGTITSVTFQRGPGGPSSFIPKFEVGLPSLGQTANIVALLASKFTRPLNIFRRL